MTDRVAGPRARPDDLTAKARIRREALHLFAEHGVGATSLRTIAASAGVTVGLIVHHYGTKEALCDAVELEVVDLFAEAIASVPVDDRPAADLVAARDVAVAEMLADNPAVVDYLRRAILHGGGDRKDLVSRLTELTAQQVRDLRTAGLASTRQTVGEQVVTIMVRQLGRLFLQPLVDRIAEEFDDLAGPSRPQLLVTLTR
ncbi:hypothetical protein BA895_11585 [Humibacillus sp. DSM 29435]|uniref:TetR/AcrR family transcriptional regulator n=1 Tax=Humibacillus sp. DSM 29435 TaxID=1869167 RepID=UPI000872A00F|nr:TetR/AcrR family transcriptional regulator [Humibacillus sp. DSM 29435]OFE14309.1 hypothetical protein BA895_11585 [Humibacillus sp. DSM 29435]